MQFGNLWQGSIGMVSNDRKLSGSLLTPSGWLAGTINWNEVGIITKIAGNSISAPAPDEPRILAGLVDLHVHGGGGADAMGGEEQVRIMACYHASQGTVALAPTTMTAPPETILTALISIEKVRQPPAYRRSLK